MVVTRVHRIGAILGLVILLAGCNVTTHVDVTVHADGSGALKTTITVDGPGVQQMGGANALAQTVPLDDLKAAGWTISPWTRGLTGSESVVLSHPFVNQADLSRRIVDLAGENGILQNPTLTRTRGWFRSRNALSIVVDVRSPSVDIVHDKTLAAHLRAAGLDPALLESQIAVQLKTVLHVALVVHMPGGRTVTYDAVPGSVKTVRVADGGTNWDHVVKFGIAVALALLAGLFFLAAGVGVRRNRRRNSQRVARSTPPDRAPLM